jgi:hypothetical protein
MKMKEVLYVPGLKKNLLSILALDKKEFRVAFIDGQVLMWPRGKTLDDVVVIGAMLHEAGAWEASFSKDKLVAEYMKTCIFVHQYR